MASSGTGRGARIARQAPQPEDVAVGRHSHMRDSGGALATLRSQSAPTSGGVTLGALQGTAGNGAVARLLRSRQETTPRRLQAKLMVGAARDPLEREADRVADLVMRTGSSRSGSGRVEEVDEAPIQRLADPGHDPASAFQADDSVAQRLAARSGGGHALPAAVRNRMEAGFGADFSEVRIHRDAEASDLSTGLAARAFTRGTDIYFAAGAYEPGSRSGQHLLAHELTHVVQQGGAAVHRNSDPGRAVVSDRRGTLRRLAYNQNPTTWPAANTLNRQRSGEGAAGVFFVNDAGPVFTPGTVVVKPMASSGEASFANRFLTQAMGFEAPDSVTYRKGTAAADVLEDVLTTAGVVGLRNAAEAQTQVDNCTQFLVMSMVEGRSIQTLDDAGATEFLQNEDALKQVGRLMVSDAFLGNEDRLVGVSPVNLGNFFYATAHALQAGKVTTIDNDSKFRAATRDAHGQLTGAMATKVFYIDQLCTNNGKNMFITRFLNKVRQSHAAHPGAIAELNNNSGWITHKISTGIDDGLRDIANVFRTNMDLVRSVGQIVDPESAPNRRVDEAKAIAHYVAERESGTDANTALNKLSQYVSYRVRRNKFPLGLKWMSKTALGAPRGF